MLDIDVFFHKGILFIRLNGNLEKNTIDKLGSEVTELIKDNGIRNIVFNISNLNSIDYYGINALLNNYEIVKKNNGKSLICGINNLVKAKISNSHLLNYMYEVANELSAINMINL